LKRAPQEVFWVGSALYPRPIPYEICPEIRSTQCSISTCFEDVYILKISKYVENFRFQGFISKMVNKL
jgi:hypothetical protein